MPQDPYADFYEQLKSAMRTPENEVDVEEAKAEVDAKRAVVLDVRDPLTFARGHIPGAVNLPLGRAAEWKEKLPKDKSARVLCVCNHGNMSLAGVAVLRALGYANSKSIRGGTAAWAQNGFPVAP